MLRIPPNLHFAHSGLHNETIPANSLTAIVAAAEAGYGVEIDIQVSHDGVPFIIHDANALKDTGVDIDIPSSNIDQLSSLTFLRNGESLCTLDEVLHAIDPKIPLLLDVKQTKHIDHTLRHILPLIEDRTELTALQSFQPTVVWKAKRGLPQMAVGQLGEESNDSMGFVQKFQTDTLITNFVTKPDFIGMYLPMLTHRITSYWRDRLDCPFIGWTVVDDEDIELCQRLGVSMVFERVRP